MDLIYDVDDVKLYELKRCLLNTETKAVTEGKRQFKYSNPMILTEFINDRNRNIELPEIVNWLVS